MLAFKLASTWLRFKIYATPSFEFHSASSRTSLHVQRRFTLPRWTVSLTNILLPVLQLTLRFTRASLVSQFHLKYYFAWYVSVIHTSLTRHSCVNHVWLRTSLRADRHSAIHSTQRPKLRLAYARRSFTSPGKPHCYLANYSFVGVTAMQSSLLGEHHCTSARTSVHIDFSYLRPSRLSASNFTQFRRPSLPTSLRIVSKRKTLIDRWE